MRCVFFLIGVFKSESQIIRLFSFTVFQMNKYPLTETCTVSTDKQREKINFLCNSTNFFFFVKFFKIFCERKGIVEKKKMQH